MKKNKQVIIGLVSQISAGKGEIAKDAKKKYNASVYRYSTMLRDVLNRLYLEVSRENLCILSKIIRKNYGENIMAKVIIEDIKKDKHKVIIIDGIRRLMDIKYLRPMKNFKLIKVIVDPKIRFERLKKRNENNGDNKKTYKQFLADQKKEAESQVLTVMKKADIKITNNGTWEEFYSQIEKIMKKLIK